MCALRSYLLSIHHYIRTIIIIRMYALPLYIYIFHLSIFHIPDTKHYPLATSQ